MVQQQSLKLHGHILIQLINSRIQKKYKKKKKGGISAKMKHLKMIILIAFQSFPTRFTGLVLIFKNKALTSLRTNSLLTLKLWVTLAWNKKHYVLIG